MKEQYLMGVDIGTTGVKVVLCNSKLSIIGAAWHSCNLYTDKLGWAEEEPEAWWNAVCQSVKKCLSQTGINTGDIAAVGTSGMVPALVLLDENLNVIRRSIQQNDVRAYREIEELRRNIDEKEFYFRTGGTINQQTLIPKFMWLRRHEPETLKKACHVLGSYDFINLKMTGNIKVERNWALESGFFDVVNRNWSETMINEAGINPQMLPSIAAPTEIIGTVTRKAASQTGLLAGTPVIGGSADHVAAALAAGLLENGDVLLKFGGAGDILYCVDKWVTDPRLFIDYHVIPGKFLVNGCMASSGSVLKWFVTNIVDNFTAQADLDKLYQNLDEAAVKIPAGALGLVVLPYFLGEKTPLFDPLARGVFFGLTLSHTKAHIYRAIMEGIAFGLKHHLEIFYELNYKVKRVLVCDGGAKSKVWRQITADVIGKKVEYIGQHQGSSAGTAFIAGMAVGLFDKWETVEKLATVTSTEEPILKNYNKYSQLYLIYRGIYEDLKEHFKNMANL